MEKTEPLFDTGVLVGLLHKDDQHHQWAKQQFERVSPPLYTCEAVLSETFHLLEAVPKGPERLLTILERGIFDLPFSYIEWPARIHNLMKTYADQPMSFADACLVFMAERMGAHRIVTTDDDFRVYRTTADESLDVLLPDT